MRKEHDVFKTTILAIIGYSASGKTTLSRKLKRWLKRNGVIVSLDDFYKDSDVPIDENGKPNHDDPNAIDINELLRVIERLKQGKSARIKDYRYANKSDKQHYKTLKPAKVIIVEGVLLMAFSQLIETFDHIIYVDADEDICEERRKGRDEERGYTLEETIYKLDNHVKPAQRVFVLPFRKIASIVINSNTKETLEAGLDFVTAFLSVKIFGEGLQHS